MTTYYRQVFEIEVLSDDEPIDGDLENIRYQITDGHCSGVIHETICETVTPERMAKLLIAQGSDPEFFGLNENGEEVED
jgi:hypothetical protein